MSGPAILRLSSYAARILHDAEYKAELWINWFGDMNEPEVADMISEMAAENKQKQISNIYPAHLNKPPLGASADTERTETRNEMGRTGQQGPQALWPH